jgi:hypothetical protein
VSPTPDALVGGPSATGVLIHRLIAELARRHGPPSPQWTAREARRVIGEWGEGGHAPVYRQAIRMRAITAAAVYFAEFARPGWRLIAALLIVGDAELDLVWQRAGRIEADELKTGRFAAAELAAARAQAARQALAGRGMFGESFAGVRVVPLTSPEQAFWVAA